jgi:hypothetical protein
MTSRGHNGGGANGGPEDEFEQPAGDAGGERAGEPARKRDRRGFDDFDDLIRDPEYDFDFDEPIVDPFGGPSRDGNEHGITETIAHLIELIAGAAGDALPPATRRRLEGMLRDLLVALRDALDRMIDQLDEHDDFEVEIEEIRID